MLRKNIFYKRMLLLKNKHDFSAKKNSYKSNVKLMKNIRKGIDSSRKGMLFFFFSMKRDYRFHANICSHSNVTDIEC